MLKNNMEISQKTARFCIAVTVNFLNKEIDKEKKILNKLINNNDSFTKNAKITSQNAKNQNKISLCINSIKEYEKILKEITTEHNYYDMKNKIIIL